MDAVDIESRAKAFPSLEIENVNNAEAISFTPEEEKALVRKIDLALLPAIWVMYLLSYLDRTNIGNAKVSGMQVDLNLTSNQYSLALVVFFIGYVLCEVPSNLVLARSKPSIFLPSIMIIWGALTCAMAAVKNLSHLIVLRVIIGCIEAGFAPGVLFVISSWYKKTEQSKRFGVFISAAVLSGAFGGLIAAGIVDSLEGAHGIRGWRWLFIIEGIMTIAFAIISVFILPDFPATTRRFSEREKHIAITRLVNDNVTATGADTNRLSVLAACKTACQDYRTWAFVVGYMVIVGSSTLTYFYPTLIEGLFGDASTKKVNLLTVPIYGVAFVATIITSILSDKVPTWRGLIIAGWLTFSLICSILVCTVYNYTARYVLLIIMAAGLWSTNGGTLAYSSSSFAGMHPQARGVALAVMNALGNLSQIYGSYLFPASDSPKYIMGFSVISAMLALGVVVFSGLHFWFRRRLTSDTI